MTLEQINALILEDRMVDIFSRLIEGDYSIEVDEEIDDLYDSLTVIGADKPTREAAEAEFLVYQQELIDQENARLAEVARLQDLTDRIAALSDKSAAHTSLNPDVPNAALWIKENILEAESVTAEANMVALESADASEKATRDAEQARAAIRAKGKLAKNACDAALAIINGYGQDLTEQEESDLMANHGAALQLLQLNKAWSFKSYIEAIDPVNDSVITAQMKQDLLDELADYGI